MVDVCWPNVFVLCVVLQACLCSWCLPLQAVTRDEVQSVLRSRMQDQASEQSGKIKAKVPTSTWAGDHHTVLTKLLRSYAKTFSEILNIFLSNKYMAKRQLTLTRHPNDTFAKNMQHCLLSCSHSHNICFGMSNLESDGADYLPLGLDSLPNITSDFT